MAQSQAASLVEAAYGAGQVAGGERVARARRLDHLDRQRRFGDGRAVAPDRGHQSGLVLDHDGGRRREEAAQGVRIPGAEGGLGLVGTEQQQVGRVQQGRQHREVTVAPERRTPVEVEADQSAGAAFRQQCAEQGEAVVGERGGDAGQVEQPGPGQQTGSRRVVQQFGGEGGRRRTAPVVVQPAPSRAEVVAVAGGAADLLEVDAGRAVRVDRDGGDVHPAGGQFAEEAAAEAVVADPADPGARHAQGGQGTGHVGLGAADGEPESLHGLQWARAVGEEYGHRLAHADGQGGGGRGGRGGCGGRRGCRCLRPGWRRGRLLGGRCAVRCGRRIAGRRGGLARGGVLAWHLLGSSEYCGPAGWGCFGEPG